MSTRQNISSGTIWEREVGYSRAVRVGNQVFVTGTLAAGADGKLLQPDDPYSQTKNAIAKIRRALVEAGADLKDVVRTRMFITSLDDAPEIGRAHHEAFGDVMPCATMVQISGLFAGACIEIEVDAVLED